MPFNLIEDPWIPIRTLDGAVRKIQPHQIAEKGVAALDWHRPDFNFACLEFLIGLVTCAAPPQSHGDWLKRRNPDPSELQHSFEPLVPAFNLDGEGKRFLQDFDELDTVPNPVDMLFIDSAGESTAKKNQDLHVKRNRYESLTLSEAAMALYTFQSQAPAGGAGNRTSMRGGGPLITLLEPGQSSVRPLWDMVWLNVPESKPVDSSRLTEYFPWLRPTVRSNDKQEVVPPKDARGMVPPETFFGMPRRLRLDFSDDKSTRVVSVRQVNYGTNYAQWRHPLTPYYQTKAGGEWLPMHPRPGNHGYRNWEGVLFERQDGLRHVAQCVTLGKKRIQSNAEPRLLVGGWSMDNMKPRDFLWSRLPFFRLDQDAQDRVLDFVEAANAFCLALTGAIGDIAGVDTAKSVFIDKIKEEYYSASQQDFENTVKALGCHGYSVEMAEKWRDVLRRIALGLFEREALPGLSTRTPQEIETIVNAHGRLQAAFNGYGNKTGKAAFRVLGLALPRRKKKESTA
ncbi:MAG: type I-E CRISPR-associated protein Cse1/CasA [Gammaproteobacteria bacterium]|nr:MAG: type I-E CRISPR-associated protein Cse1/CasA [Gammaproteobacteria bacterium]